MSIRIKAEIVYEGILVVQADLDKKFRSRLLVDTGASYSALTETFIRSNPPLIIRPSGRTWSAGTAGSASQVDMPSFSIRRLSVGPIVKHDLEFVRLDLPADIKIDGLLGVNFLRDFRVTFDFVDGWIEFAERK